MLDKFIGIDGRINRKKYIFRSLFLWGMGFIFELCVIMGRVEQPDFMAGDLPGMVLLTIVGIPWMMLMVRRLHDLNRNGFWSLLVFAGLCARCFVLPLPVSLLFSRDEREKLVWRGSARKESGYVEGAVKHFLKCYNEIIKDYLKQQKRLYKENLHTVFQEQIACRLLLYPTA